MTVGTLVDHEPGAVVQRHRIERDHWTGAR
jgi:hypothetical protein